jgi:hypothetical protein
MTEEKLGPFPHEIALDQKKRERPVYLPPSAKRTVLPHEEIKIDIGKKGEAKPTAPKSHQLIKPL